jgi:uncharacterized phiE125 gp8 family phage protein
MNYALTLVTPPAGVGATPSTEPLTLAEAKVYARIEETTEDALVLTLIRAAREAVEDHGIACLSQTWEWAADRFPAVIRIPKVPFQSVTFLKYTASDGTLTTLDASDYQVDTRSTPGRIFPAYGTSWPVTRAIPNAVLVRFVCGFGDGATPADYDGWELIRQYMRMAVKAMYWNEVLPATAERLLDRFQVWV